MSFEIIMTLGVFLLAFAFVYIAWAIDRKYLSKNKKNVKNKENKRESPEEKRISDLNTELLFSRIFTIIGILLVIYSVYFGWIGDGFFILSLEFIMGLIISTIGLIWTHNHMEKIKDLEMKIANKKLKAKKTKRT